MGGMGGQPPPPVNTEPKLGEVCKVISLNQLNKLINDYPGLIVDFWSPTCPPCMRIKPTFEAAAKSNENENLVFAAVNTQEAPDCARAHNVNAIPNFIAFLNGKPFKNFKGANEPVLFSTIAELADKVPEGKVVKASQHDKILFK